MEFDDDDDESGRTFTTLTNYYNEPMNDSKLHFEKFLFAGDSDSEVEHEENFTYSDDSNGFEEEVQDIEDPLNVLSDASQHFSQGSEDWRNSDSQCLTLTELMRMNRNEKFQLLQLFHKIKDFLIDIQNRMKILKTSSQKIRTKESIMFLGHVGAPYFKTKKDMFCSDPNPDTLDRRKRGLLTIYQHGFPSRWSKTECDNLTRGVKLTYNLNKQRAILKDIGYLRRKIVEETDSAIILQKEYEIEKKEGEIRNLKAIGIEDVPPLCEDKFIDWEHISTEYLMEKHTAKECSIFWRIYLHPDLNKSNWSTRENKVIRELAEKYNYQDWDRIAQELGTNRSAFTIFIHYSSTLCHQPIKMRFSEEEDRALLQHIESKKTGAIIPWNTIAEFFPNRSKIQLIHRC
ncbi:snRNA-activating protein complex subunit 4 isoform X2 [Coccinella septempunctata]|uniref:snRNA-activating protein complex subunit 4 isoform X2 n=1 Tax=Coccinella septempunctata TaxID=41139 RepID=UPI001D0782B2|nr:snRNA-activating protein complex subunit 4 isoform X2 [Coccinella septempunctata]